MVGERALLSRLSRSDRHQDLPDHPRPRLHQGEKVLRPPPHRFLYRIPRLVAVLLVEGGFSNIPLFVNNVLGFGSEGRGLGASNVSVDNFVAKFFWVLQQIFKVDFSKAEKVLSTILSGLVILVTVVLSFFPRKKGDVMPYTLLLIGCYLLFQTISYSYVFIFYTYVGLLLIQRWDELPFNRKALYVICLLILAQPFPLVWHLAFFGATANAILFGVSVYDLIKLLLRKEEAETALAKQTPSSIEEKAPKELGDNIA